MSIRKLILGSVCVAIVTLLSVTSLAVSARAFSVPSDAQISASQGTAPGEALEPFKNWGKGLRASVASDLGYRTQDFAQNAATSNQSAADKDAQTISLLFGTRSNAGEQELATVAAEIEALARPTSSNHNSCWIESNCATMTASAVPGPIWLIVSVLIGMLGVGTRRSRMAAT